MFVCPRRFVPSPAGPARLLTDLTRAFARLSLDWYVFGAQAVLLWGRPRMTTDVDVTARLGDVSTEALVAVLEREGFILRVQATPGFVRLTRVLPLAHDASGLARDVVLAGPGLEDDFIRRRAWVDVGGVSIPVICAEDLLVTKVLAGREKDIEDIRGVLAERGERLDLPHVRSVIALLEEALGQSDLLPLIDSEIRRWRKMVQR